MKHRLLCLLLALVLLFSAVPAASAEYSPEEQYDALLEVQDLIRKKGLESGKDDEPLRRAMIAILEQDPKLYDALMKEMLDGYDPFTMFLPAGSYSETFAPDTSYVGVGVTVQTHPLGALIVDVHQLGPAAAAGVHMGDVITAVEGEPVQGLRIGLISDKMRGEEGSYVTLTLQRGEETLEMRMRRTKLSQINYSGTQLDDGIFYMKWKRIMDDGSYWLYRMDLAQMVLRGDHCLILDLRDDPGGSLDLAFSLISDLLPDAEPFFTTYVRNPRGKEELERRFISSEGGGADIPHIFILVNEKSASASEIIAASLRDTRDAVLIGEPTFGKARAQQHIVLEDDSAIILTTMKLLPLKGEDYHNVGIQPDHKLRNPVLETDQAIVLPTVPLAPWNCSDNAADLNRALFELGYLKKLPEKLYQLGGETQDALDLLRTALMLPHEEGAGALTLRKINQLLTLQRQGRYERDDQLSLALELARQALAEDAAADAEEVPAP